MKQLFRSENLRNLKDSEIHRGFGILGAFGARRRVRETIYKEASRHAGRAQDGFFGVHDLILRRPARRKLAEALKLAAAAFLAAALLTGCGSGLEEPYSFAERGSNLGVSEGSASLAPLFASDLCVIDGETPDGGALVTAEAGALFNVSDGTVLYSKNAYEELYPASITKVMTAILAIEEGNLDDTVTVTQDAVITESGASLCGIKPGDTLTLEQLLYGLLIPSGNDAANAIAVHMSGSVDAFAGRMNEKARELGATHTHFKNPSGLTDPEHYTTAYDLYLIFNEALKLPKFREIIGADSYTATYADAGGNAVSKTWSVGNWYQKGEEEAPEGVTVLGGKTGTTQAAGYCLIMAEQDENGKGYISAVLKADNRRTICKSNKSSY